MIDVYVLDQNLNQVGIVDTYKSLIWSNRYREIGDCELYVEASVSNFQLLKKNYYLMRLDDEMVCRIKYIELDTDTESGNFLAVHGYDVKDFLDQRIIWGTMTNNGKVEMFIRQMVTNTLISPNLSARWLIKPNGQSLLALGAAAGFNEVTSEQVSYKNVGEKVREYCLKYGWGYKVILTGETFYFYLYRGSDRTASVVFSDDFENLNTTSYVEDDTRLKNVALVGGEGEGSERSRNVSGYAESTERYEIFVDAKDVSKTITWQNLTDTYPTTDSGGQGYISTSGGAYVYKLNYLNIPIVDSDQLTQLKINYPSGQEVTIDNAQYYQVYNEIVADLPSNTLADGDNVTLRPLVYEVYLLTRGYEHLSEYEGVTSFQGSIEPNITFVFKDDYFLGDLVTVENEYGLSVGARIVEIVEVDDDKGYRVEPKFEYLEVN